MSYQNYDDEAGTGNFLAGVVVGAILGAGIALLLAPQAGQGTRTRLRRAVHGARLHALDRWDDLTDDLKEAVELGRRRLKL